MQNPGRRWTLDDLIQACSDALYELEGKDTYVSKRTVQLDLQMMRGDKLGYLAPIEVYEKKYYRYADPDYSITDVPLTGADLEVLTESVTMLRQFKDFSLFAELNGVIQKLEDRIYRQSANGASIIHLDKNEQLKGLEHLDTLYQAINKQIVVRLGYQSFTARKPGEILLHPYILKEFNNRWFLVGRRDGTEKVVNLALDRILRVTPDLRAEYRKENFDPEAYYRHTFGVTVHNGSPLDIRLWVDRHNAPYVLTKPLHHSQELLERREDHSIVLGLQLQQNYELERLLLGFGEGVEVLAPNRLRRRIHHLLRRAVRRYAPKDQ
nr:WYL domain-containing protein [Lewinella sp. W8]